MSFWSEEMPDFDELPEEEIERLQEEDLEVPEVRWKEDIENIEDLELKEKEIHIAEKLLEEEKDLDEKLERGEIDQIDYELKYQGELLPNQRKSATRSAIESVGITYDKIGEVVDKYDDYLTGDIKEIERREEQRKEHDRLMGGLQEVVETLGPEKAQNIAESMKQDEKFEGEKSYDFISNQIDRFNKRKK